MTKLDDWRGAVARLSSMSLSVDGLVNNAGINVKYPPLEMPEPEWDRCLETNLRGAWYGTRAVLPEMLARGSGAIVNRIIPGSFPYPVSKHALIGLTRALAVEYARHGIRVNAISPGYVDTALVRDWWESQPDPSVAEKSTLALIPAGHRAQPNGVAMTCVFLLSDEAPSINGVVVPVDGASLAQFHP